MDEVATLELILGAVCNNMLTNMNTQFPWFRMTSPIEEWNNHIYTSHTRKLRARWSPELAQDLNAWGRVNDNNLENGLINLIADSIATELILEGNRNIQGNPDYVMGIYQLCLTPTIYDPMNFTPMKGILIRYSSNTPNYEPMPVDMNDFPYNVTIDMTALLRMEMEEQVNSTVVISDRIRIKKPKKFKI